MSSKKKPTLSTAEWSRLTDLYLEGEPLTGAARDEFLRRASRDDARLFETLKEMLQSDSKIVDFLETPAVPRLVPDPPTARRAPSPFSPGQKVGDFLILRSVGKGSFATVYLARQISLDRIVALKVSENIGQEAKTMAHLEHDHIVTVYSEEVLPDLNLRMICMQYVDGVSLEKIIQCLQVLQKSRPDGSAILEIIDELVPTPAAFNPKALKDRQFLSGLDAIQTPVWLGMRLADALAYAHGKGVLHLDVKPGNILMNSYGRPSLTDFNISLDSREIEESSERFGGTFQYMPPEQAAVFSAADKPAAIAQIDGRADTFALGVVIREVWNAFLRKTTDSPPAPPESLEGHVERILERATAPDPRARFASADALAKALEWALELRRIHKALPPVGAVGRYIQHHPLLALTLSGTLLQLVAVIFGVAYNSMRIVHTLTLPQQHVFELLLAYFNPVVYLIATAIWLHLLWRLRDYLQNPTPYFAAPAKTRKLRRLVLRVPKWVAALTLLGWVPSSFAFPLTIHWAQGPLPTSVFLHFFISFDLSCLIAFAYSVLAAYYLCLRFLYPRFWAGCPDIQQTARKELRSAGSRIRRYYFLTGLIPLIGAVLVVSMGPERMDADHYQGFRFLVTGLITLGVVGIYFALALSQNLSRTLFALTGTNPADELVEPKAPVL